MEGSLFSQLGNSWLDHVVTLFRVYYFPKHHSDRDFGLFVGALDDDLVGYFRVDESGPFRCLALEVWAAFVHIIDGHPGLCMEFGVGFGDEAGRSAPRSVRFCHADFVVGLPCGST